MLLRRLLIRLMGALVVVWGAATLAFAVLKLVPGDPVDVMLGVNSTASEDVRQQIRNDLGLDQPVISQYLGYLGRLVTGDLGTSYRLQKPVATVITEQLGPTITLALASIVIALVLAIVVSVAARGPITRRIAELLELLALSSPGFWTGLLLLTIFSFNLHWFPVTGGQGARALVLPAVTMALPIAGILSQLLRSGFDAAEREPFTTSARARGLGPVRMFTRHHARHGSLPVVTLTAYIMGSLLGGTVIVEQLFGRRGIGRITLDAITNRDLPVVMALVVMAAVVFVVVNLIVDALYPLLDARLRGRSV